MVIIWGIVFLKRAPPLKPKIINVYLAKKDGYYLGETVSKKNPP
jgi:hypothetical protein